MHAYSTVDGFLEVKEGVDEMIKYLANEPSVGLFFVQQHAQTCMPYLLDVKNKVSEKIQEVTLHTEDIEDSIEVVKAMTEFGLPIADEMIKDINRSLLITATSQLKRGLISNPSWGFQASRSNLSTPTTFDENPENAEEVGRGSLSYLSGFFSSAKQKASILRWPQTDMISEGLKGDQSVASMVPWLPSATGSGGEADELPLSSQLADDQPDKPECSFDVSSLLENYDKFTSEREAKLEEWLQGTEDGSGTLKPAGELP